MSPPTSEFDSLEAQCIVPLTSRCWPELLSFILITRLCGTSCHIARNSGLQNLFIGWDKHIDIWITSICHTLGVVKRWWVSTLTSQGCANSLTSVPTPSTMSMFTETSEKLAASTGVWFMLWHTYTGFRAGVATEAEHVIFHIFPFKVRSHE